MSTKTSIARFQNRVAVAEVPMVGLKRSKGLNFSKELKRLTSKYPSSFHFVKKSKSL